MLCAYDAEVHNVCPQDEGGPSHELTREMKILGLASVRIFEELNPYKPVPEGASS